MAVILAAVGGEAATIRVPQDSPTVLAAVDLAAPGDSVLIGPGTWSDRETRGDPEVTACAFPRPDVVIRGSGAGITVLAVGPSSTGQVAGVHFDGPPGTGVVSVEAITFTGVSGDGEQAASAIAAVAAQTGNRIEVRSCRFEGNVSWRGAAIFTTRCTATIEDCDFVNNDSVGGVVRIWRDGLTMRRCRFLENTGRALDLSGYAPPYGYVLIEDCEFVRNRGHFQAAGVYLNTNLAFILRCRFLENVLDGEYPGLGAVGAALNVAWGGSFIRHCVFARDSCYSPTGRGSAIHVDSAQAFIENNTFFGCYAPSTGAVVSAYTAQIRFQGNLVSETRGGQAMATWSTDVFTNGCNLYWANEGGDFGDGWTASPTDVFQDPLFCDAAGLDFSVRSDSPCVTFPGGCPQIGALGTGCGPVAVQSSTFGRIKAMFR